eukprot:s2367_g4.t1
MLLLASLMVPQSNWLRRPMPTWWRTSHGNSFYLSGHFFSNSCADIQMNSMMMFLIAQYALVQPMYVNVRLLQQQCPASLASLHEAQKDLLRCVEDTRWFDLPHEMAIPILHHPRGHEIFVVAHLFSGRRRVGDVHDRLHFWAEHHGLQLLVLSLDTATSAVFGNLHHTSVTWEKLQQLYREGRISATLAGAPCETWSAARHNQVPDEESGRPFPRPLRDAERILGRGHLSFRELRQLEQGILFFLQTLITMAWSLITGALYISERPAIPLLEEAANVWKTPWIRLLCAHPAVVLHTLGQWRSHHMWMTASMFQPRLIHLQMEDSLQHIAVKVATPTTIRELALAEKALGGWGHSAIIRLHGHRLPAHAFLLPGYTYTVEIRCSAQALPLPSEVSFSGGGLGFSDQCLGDKMIWTFMNYLVASSALGQGTAAPFLIYPFRVEHLLRSAPPEAFTLAWQTGFRHSTGRILVICELNNHWILLVGSLQQDLGLSWALFDGLQQSSLLDKVCQAAQKLCHLLDLDFLGLSVSLGLRQTLPFTCGTVTLAQSAILLGLWGPPLQTSSIGCTSHCFDFSMRELSLQLGQMMSLKDSPACSQRKVYRQHMQLTEHSRSLANWA